MERIDLKLLLSLSICFFLFYSCSYKKDKEIEKSMKPITKTQLPISEVINSEKSNMLLGDWTIVKMVIKKKFKEETSIIKDTMINIHISKEGFFSDQGIKLGKNSKENSTVFNLAIDTLEGRYFLKANIKKPNFFILQNPGVKYNCGDNTIGYIKTQLYFVRK